jgi:hypothetical protein
MLLVSIENSISKFKTKFPFKPPLIILNSIYQKLKSSKLTIFQQSIEDKGQLREYKTDEKLDHLN